MDAASLISSTTGLDGNDVEGIAQHGKKIAQKTLIGVGVHLALGAIDWITGRAPFSSKDQIRRRALVTAYNKLGLTAPDYWTLDDKHRPNFQFDYNTYITLLTARATEKIDSNSAIRQAQGLMFSMLARYIESISKRSDIKDYISGSAVRPDGVEAMFFKEMIHWIMDKLPNLPESDKDSCAEIKKRITYCQEVYDLATVNKYADVHRVNPTDTLERLISQLTAYHNSLNQKQESSTFNDFINNLSNHLLGLSTQSLLMLHLLIRDVNQSTLIVDQFNRPNKSDEKIHALREKKLGDWLYKTLQLGGIGTSASTFESKNIMSLEAIANHLEGEHPLDEKCILSQDLKDSTHPMWGHWEFAMTSIINQPKKIASQIARACGLEKKQEGLDDKAWAEIKAQNYLQQIRELHRSTLHLYYIRQNLVRTAVVTGVFGEIWVYGDPVGKAVLAELLALVLEVTNDYNELFNSFWKEYFTEDYLIYSKEKRQNDVDYLSHRWLTEINREIKTKITSITAKISTSVTNIQNQSQCLPQHLEKADKSKKELFSDLLAFLKLKGKDSSENYKVINSALSTFKFATPLTEVLSEVEKIKRNAYEKANYKRQQEAAIQEETSRRMNEFFSDHVKVNEAIAQYLALEKEAHEKELKLIEEKTDTLAIQINLEIDAKEALKNEMERQTILMQEERLKEKQSVDVNLAREEIEKINTNASEINPNPLREPNIPSTLMQSLRAARDSFEQMKIKNQLEFDAILKAISDSYDRSVTYEHGSFPKTDENLTNHTDNRKSTKQENVSFLEKSDVAKQWLSLIPHSNGTKKSIANKTAANHDMSHSTLQICRLLEKDAFLVTDYTCRFLMTLGIDANVGGSVTYQTLKGAYRRSILNTHPDKASSNNKSNAEFRGVQAAYQYILAELDSNENEDDRNNRRQEMFRMEIIEDRAFLKDAISDVAEMLDGKKKMKLELKQLTAMIESQLGLTPTQIEPSEPTASCK